MANLFQPMYSRLDLTTGLRVTRKVRVWWAQYRGPRGIVRVSLKTTNKGAAQLKLADLVRDAQAGRDGVDLRYHGKRPFATQLADWQAAMTARGLVTEHSAQTTRRVQRAATACSWRVLADCESGAALRFLAKIQADGVSAKTRNDYCDSLKAFGRWLAQAKRVDESPFANLRHVSTTTDRRHDRRPLNEGELGRLLAAAEESAKTWCGLKGIDRHALYLAAMCTGFRAGELASLTPHSFALEESPPVVRLAAAHAKNRRAAVQPIPAEVVPALRVYLARRARDQPIWPGRWIECGGAMMQIDLADAGIPYVVQGPDGPLFADFHALRHSYIAMLDRPGVTLKQAMTLARHSDPRLTMKIYGRAAMADLAATVDGAFSGFAPREEPSPTLPFRTAQ
jgi:integrase